MEAPPRIHAGAASLHMGDGVRVTGLPTEAVESDTGRWDGRRAGCRRTTQPPVVERARVKHDGNPTTPLGLRSGTGHRWSQAVHEGPTWGQAILATDVRKEFVMDDGGEPPYAQALGYTGVALRSSLIFAMRPGRCKGQGLVGRDEFVELVRGGCRASRYACVTQIAMVAIRLIAGRLRTARGRTASIHFRRRPSSHLLAGHRSTRLRCELAPIRPPDRSGQERTGGDT